MRWFAPRFKKTESSPKLVAFFFSQYVEVMKHGHDRTDDKMKDYLYSVITDLGVPEEPIEMVEQQSSPLELPQDGEQERSIIIHRR